MDLHEKVRAIRESRGLSKKQFGELLHCTGSWIGEIEKGAKAPSDTLLTLMIQKMGVSLDWWETGEGPMFAGEEKEKLPMDSRRELAFHEFNKDFDSAEDDSEKLELVSDLLSFLAKRRKGKKLD